MTNSTTITPVDSKRCPKCDTWKDIDSFYKNRSQKDGRQAYCKPCHLAYLKEPHRAAYRSEFSKEYNQRPEVIEARKERQKEYVQQENVRRRKRSYEAVTRAIWKGELPRASLLKCTACDEQAEEYHHFMGYDKIHHLTVIPVCMKCHRKIPRFVEIE